MSIYQRGENWYIDFTYKGQRVRESIGPSRKSAEKIVAKKKTEIAENKYLDVRKDPDPITFHEFAKEYLQWAKANKKVSTYVHDLSITRALDREFGSKNLLDITTWQIEKYKAARKEKVKPASVNREMCVLKHIFSKAFEWGKLKENPSRKVKKLKGEVQRVRFLMPDEVQTLLSNCSDRIREVVTVAVHTGMRKGEILGLESNQVNFDQGIISLFEPDTKNHERRDVPMDETVKGILRGLGSNGGCLFHNVDKGVLHRLFHEAMEKSGISDFRFHDLRHTFASNLVMAGQDLNTVRELLGHKDMAMTLRYAHLAPNLKKKAVEILDQVLTMAQNPPQSEATGKVVSINR